MGSLCSKYGSTLLVLCGAGILVLVPSFALRSSLTEMNVASTGSEDGEPVLERLIEFAGESGSDVLIVWKDGKPVTERWFTGSPRRLRAWSISKSIASLAVLRLLSEGSIRSLDEPVATWVPSWKGTAKERILLRHILTHTSGLAESWAGFNGSFVDLAESQELEAEPGERFRYSNIPINLISAVVEQVAGVPMDAYLHGALLGPLGVTDYEWRRDSDGNPDIMGGLEIAPQDLVLVGELMRREGLWNERIIKREYVLEAVTAGPSPGVGLLWWIDSDCGAFYAQGVHGQFLLIVPSSSAVVLRMRDRETAELENVGTRLCEFAGALGRNEVIAR